MEPKADLSLIDEVTYTASLATRPSDIDDLLDTLREVTADIDRTQPLTEFDRQKLVSVQEQLEIYLTTREPIRFFTRESLKLQIEQYMQGGVGNKSRKQLIVILVAAAAASVVTACLPSIHTMEQRVQAGGAMAFGLITVGAAWLFLTALPAFQSSLRRAFKHICIGATLLGFGMVAQAVIVIASLRHYWLVSVLYSIPFLIAAITFHIGNMQYVRLLGVTSRWTTPYPLLGLAAVISLITWFVPHPPTTESELIHDIVAVLWVGIMLTPIPSIFVLPAARRRLPELYKPTISPLYHSMFAILAVCVYQWMLRIVAGPSVDGPKGYALFALAVLMAVMLIRAGYAFNKVSKY